MATAASLSDSSRMAHLAAYTVKDPDPNRFVLLSLSGGGVRGSITLEIMKKIEEVAGDQFCNMCTHFAGTSVGSFLAAGSVVSLNGKAPLTASAMLDIFTAEAPKIFTRTYGQYFKTFGGLSGPKYNPAALYSMVDTYLQDVPLKDTLRPLLIPAADLRDCKPYNFTTALNQSTVGSAVKASSAAATFFPPFKVNGSFFEDGGDIENNPVMDGYLDMTQGHAGLNKKIYVISIGTGHTYTSVDVKNRRETGLLFWSSNAIKLTLTGVENMIEEQMFQLINTPINPSNQQGYEFFNPLIANAHDALDDASPSNLAYLRETTQSYLEEEVIIDALRETARTINPSNF